MPQFSTMKYLLLMNVTFVAPSEAGQYHQLISNLKEVNPELKYLALLPPRTV